jgi:hypothetical protein
LFAADQNGRNPEIPRHIKDPNHPKLEIKKTKRLGADNSTHITDGRTDGKKYMISTATFLLK